MYYDVKSAQYCDNYKIKLTFEDGKEYATLPVWVLKEALNDYFSDQRKCNRNTSMIAC